MKPEELIKSCQEQIDIVGDNAEKAIVMRGKYGKRNYRTLCGIKGEIVWENQNGTITVMFPTKDLMKAIQKELTKQERRG